jgi:molybdate transport system permease protein
MSVHRRTRGVPAAILVAAVVGALFVILPVIGLALRAPWARLGEAFAGTGAATALRLSAVVSLLATVLAVGMGVPLAWVLARIRFPGRSILRAFVVLPVVLPPVVGGVALLAVLGRQGVVGGWLFDVLGVQLTFTTAGAVVAAAFVSMPLVVLAAEAGFRSIDPGLEAAAASLGGRPGYVLRRVTLPTAAPQLAAGAVLAWARALGEFGATITFAGNLPGRTQTLPLAVYQTRQTDPGGAVALSLVLVAISVIVLVALRDRLMGPDR